MKRIRRPLLALAPIALAALALGAGAVGCRTLDGARLYREGTEALERGDFASAVVALERAAERVPRASEVQNRLGLAYLAADRPGAALRAFERAVRLDCGNTAARQNRERTRRRAGR